MSQFLPFNLTCGRGHRYYAPRVEWVEWVGRDCLAGSHMRADGLTTHGRCLRPLYPIGARPEPSA